MPVAGKDYPQAKTTVLLKTEGTNEPGTWGLDLQAVQSERSVGGRVPGYVGLA